jgi:hypothetical protein
MGFRNRPVVSLLCFLVSLLLLFDSCAVQHKQIAGMRDWSFPQSQFDNVFSFGYVDHVLDQSGNKRASRWAKRKNIHVIGIRIINNSNKPIHGMQIALLDHEEKQVEVIHNLWLAKKVRQRISPFMLLFIPAFIAEAALLHSDDENLDEFYRSPYEPEPYYISEEFANQAEAKRMKANFDLQSELMNFQLAKQVLEPGKAVYGIMGIRCKGSLRNLRVEKREIGFEVISTTTGQ